MEQVACQLRSWKKSFDINGRNALARNERIDFCLQRQRHAQCRLLFNHTSGLQQAGRGGKQRLSPGVLSLSAILPQGLLMAFQTLEADSLQATPYSTPAVDWLNLKSRHCTPTRQMRSKRSHRQAAKNFRHSPVLVGFPGDRQIVRAHKTVRGVLRTKLPLDGTKYKAPLGNRSDQLSLGCANGKSIGNQTLNCCRNISGCLRQPLEWPRIRLLTEPRLHPYKHDSCKSCCYGDYKIFRPNAHVGTLCVCQPRGGLQEVTHGQDQWP